MPLFVTADEYSKLESEFAQLKSEFDDLHLQCINKDCEIEMLKTEVSELRKSKMLEIVEQKMLNVKPKSMKSKEEIKFYGALLKIAERRGGHGLVYKTELMALAKLLCFEYEQVQDWFLKRQVCVKDDTEEVTFSFVNPFFRKEKGLNLDE